MISHKNLAAALTLIGSATLSGAQIVHETDIVMRHGADGHIETGLPAAGGGIDWGVRIGSGRLDEGQFSNLADDPGFDSLSGSFPPGTQIGLDLLAALRVWDGDDFETIDPDFAMSVTKGDSIITTPMIDERVPGFTFGSADVNGRFHHHVRFFLDPFDPFSDVPGLWLLELELWSTNAAVLPSEPVYIVWASGSVAVSQRDDAVEWVEQNLIGGPCSLADLAEPLGVLDLTDISTFVGAFSAQDPIADIAEPFGVLDLTDLSAFVGAFVAGCP